MPMTGRTYRRLASGVVATTLAVLPSLPVWAEAAAHEGGLPQLRTEFYVGQLFWLFVCFGVTYLLMSRVAIPAVQRTQEKRMRLLRADLDAAATASEQARTIQADYEKTLADSRAKAHAIFIDTSAAIAKESAAQQAALQAQLSQRVNEAEKSIAASRDAALKDVEGAAKDLAASIVENIIGQKAGASR